MYYYNIWKSEILSPKFDMKIFPTHDFVMNNFMDEVKMKIQLLKCQYYNVV